MLLLSIIFLLLFAFALLTYHCDSFCVGFGALFLCENSKATNGDGEKEGERQIERMFVEA